MNSSLISALPKKSTIVLFPFLILFCIAVATGVMAEKAPATGTTDLSQMDWSDEPEQEETDLSKMDWSDEAEGDSDLSQQSWDDEPSEGGDLSEASWEDSEGEKSSAEGDDTFMEMSVEAEQALADKEWRIHFYGFILFIGYILGGILTAYFTRDRKVAVDYPPELLIILHTLWPLEWLFLVFAGKKVR